MINDQVLKPEPDRRILDMADKEELWHWASKLDVDIDLNLQQMIDWTKKMNEFFSMSEEEFVLVGSCMDGSKVSSQEDHGDVDILMMSKKIVLSEQLFEYMPQCPAFLRIRAGGLNHFELLKNIALIDNVYVPASTLKNLHGNYFLLHKIIAFSRTLQMENSYKFVDVSQESAVGVELVKLDAKHVRSHVMIHDEITSNTFYEMFCFAISKLIHQFLNVTKETQDISESFDGDDSNDRKSLKMLAVVFSEWLDRWKNKHSEYNTKDESGKHKLNDTVQLPCHSVLDGTGTEHRMQGVSHSLTNNHTITSNKISDCKRSTNLVSAHMTENVISSHPVYEFQEKSIKKLLTFDTNEIPQPRAEAINSRQETNKIPQPRAEPINESQKINEIPQPAAEAIINTQEISIRADACSRDYNDAIGKTYEFKKLKSIDFVPAFRFNGWPRTANEWVTRKRAWPSSDIIERILRVGCQVIAKRPPDNLCIDEAASFRLSFACCEQVLSSNMCKVQKTCWRILKAFQKAYLKTEPCVLTSYCWKNIMFWICEETNSMFWAKEKLLYAVEFSLDFMIICLQKREIPLYFVRDANLIEGCHTKAIEEVLHMVKKIRSQPVKFLRRFIECPPQPQKHMSIHDSLEQLLLMHNKEKNRHKSIETMPQTHPFILSATNDSMRTDLPNILKAENVKEYVDNDILLNKARSINKLLNCIESVAILIIVTSTPILLNHYLKQHSKVFSLIWAVKAKLTTMQKMNIWKKVKV